VTDCTAFKPIKVDSFAALRHYRKGVFTATK